MKVKNVTVEVGTWSTADVWIEHEGKESKL